MRILMFGNSFTYYNDMPAMLSELLKAEVRAVTRGGAKLSEFRDPEREIGREAEDVLRSGRWDYVVLQDQSSRPVRFRDSFLRDVHILCRKIRSVGACPLLFATWPYRPGADQYRKTGLDFDSLGEGLSDAYKTAGEKEGLPVADAGRRFIRLWESGDAAAAEGLYAQDGSHPGMAGSRIPRMDPIQAKKSGSSIAHRSAAKPPAPKPAIMHFPLSSGIPGRKFLRYSRIYFNDW